MSGSPLAAELTQLAAWGFLRSGAEGYSIVPDAKTRVTVLTSSHD